MTILENQTYDEERALYGSSGVLVRNCRFDGPADGESALKESHDVRVEHCFMNLRYPFWHDEQLTIHDSELTPLCRAALWYSHHIEITDTKLHGIKAVRGCAALSGQSRTDHPSKAKRPAPWRSRPRAFRRAKAAAISPASPAGTSRLWWPGRMRRTGSAAARRSDRR